MPIPSEDYIKIFELYVRNHFNARAAEREFRERYQRATYPSPEVFQETYKRFRETGCVFPKSTEPEDEWVMTLRNGKKFIP